MKISLLWLIAFGLASILLLPIASLRAVEQVVVAELVEFKNQAGQFSIGLPGEPLYEKTTVGDAQETQHQYTVPMEQGVYLISYQENPNLEGKGPKELASALVSGRDRLQEVFQGELVESKSIALDKSHPGLQFRFTIPAANGEARCRFYLVGTRLYQLMALGAPDFAQSDQATRVIESFKLLK
ncbi:hypothetical protein [Bythopirellula goksoeyrii]|uniref:PsbP C-terminal domain-containing protein n=1 Tax=Bythopirellula goksoeyrii TaxID=1400387 RepID=A0A5B9QLM0_9BACT|nr:hypothetical protein [Bythopirellula goksoeyrii]QEG34953.1 hypothetical protein Pr1d_22420 [Bythopirellula goksoeyrii]